MDTQHLCTEAGKADENEAKIKPGRMNFFLQSLYLITIEFSQGNQGKLLIYLFVDFGR